MAEDGEGKERSEREQDKDKGIGGVGLDEGRSGEEGKE